MPAAAIAQQPTNQADRDQIVQLLLRWRQDPVAFVREAIGVEPVDWQQDALSALLSHDRIAIRSAHGVGKTSFLSWTMLWWITTHYPSKIGCTAPSAPQLEDALWGELATWYRRLPDALRGLYTLTKDRLELTEAPKESFGVARTARKEQPEALQGLHSENMLFIIDEASGVDDIIFEVAAGAMSTPGAKTIMTSNPTRTSGYFFNAFTKARQYWHCMKVAWDPKRTYQSKTYGPEIAAIHGESSNAYRIRVLGEFPVSDDDAVIPYHLVESAIARAGTIEHSKAFSPVWGLDVARFGDDRSALCKRWGNKVLEPIRVWQGKDTMQTTGLVVQEYFGTALSARPERIIVDVIGMGSGVVDRLREQGLPVIGLNVAERPAQEGRFLRLRDEVWWRAREWLEERDAILPDDPTLIAELTQVRYDMTSAGKIRVETKDSLKKRGQRSPDVADSFIMTFALPDLYASAKRAYEPDAFYDS